MSLFSRNRQNQPADNSRNIARVDGILVNTQGKQLFTLRELMDQLDGGNRVIHQIRSVVIHKDEVKVTCNNAFGDAAVAAYYINALVSDFIAKSSTPAPKALSVIESYFVAVNGSMLNLDREVSTISTEIKDSYAGTHQSLDHFVNSLVENTLNQIDGTPSLYDITIRGSLDTDKVLRHYEQNYVTHENHYYKKVTNV